MTDNLFVYRGNYITGVGTPLLLIAFGERTGHTLAVESYLFLCAEKRRFIPEIRDWSFTDAIPKDLLTADQFVAEAVSAAEAKLEQLVSKEHADKYQAFLLKWNGLKLQPNATLEIMNLSVRHAFRSELLNISHRTQNKPLSDLIRSKCQNRLNSDVMPFE